MWVNQSEGMAVETCAIRNSRGKCAKMTKTDKQPKAGDKPSTAAQKRAGRTPRRGWLKLAGWAQDDPLYDQAMKLGADWRKSS